MEEDPNLGLSEVMVHQDQGIAWADNRLEGGDLKHSAIKAIVARVRRREVFKDLTGNKHGEGISLTSQYVEMRNL